MTAPYATALVIGLGKSGLAAARLLTELGTRVRVYDRQPLIEGVPEDCERYLGSSTPPAEAFGDLDLLVLSPGVPPGPILELHALESPTAKIHGELGLALELIATSNGPPDIPTVLITGTNGKSTVTALTGALLEAGGRTPFVGGNLGFPLADRVRSTLMEDAPWPTDLVLECSSYQLETLPRFPTDVAMILNVTPDHLDRYPSMNAYAHTKARAFMGLRPGGLALLHDRDPWTDAIAPHRSDLSTVRVEAIGDTWIENGDLYVAGRREFAIRDLPIMGRHNAVNALFALRAAAHLGIEASARARGVNGFKGLPHRMTWVRKLGGVDYYDDSKATNVASALAGLDGLDRPFVLIAGGIAKGDDLAPLGALLRTHGRGLVAIGESASSFCALTTSPFPTERAASMEAAVSAAREMAKPGDIVVLSPACASFDQFRNYAHRGDVFAQAVTDLPERLET